MTEPGTLLQNRYRLESRAGQGGMGTVFLARDERFGSRVAVKQTFFDDPALRKAFEREAHLLNRLRHGALPKVSDHFVEGDGQFLVMEFIEGDDLSEMLEKRGAPFAAADVLRWGDELLDALDYLHTQEPPVIHRDIKPQNLKLAEPGRKVVLLDFGLAKGTLAHTNASGATASVFGYSRSYAALEQIQGAGTDPRSDLYSLAATLYHLLTGRAPADALARASAAVNNQPDPLLPAHRVRPDGVPAAVGLALHRAMALKAALRPHTAAEMRAALRQAAQSLPATSAHAHASNARGGQAPSEVTLIEPAAATAGRHNSTVARDTTRVRADAAASRWDVSEATVVDQAADPARRPAMSYVPSYAPSQADDARPAGGSRTKFLGFALAALALCAAAAYAFMQGPLAPQDGTAARTQTAPAADAAQAGATQPAAPGATQTTLPAAYDANAPAQPARYGGSAQQPSAQPVQGSAGAASAGGTTPGAAGGGAEDFGSSTDISASGGGDGLTIHRPAPSPQSNDESRPTEESRPAAFEPSYRPPVEERRPPPAYGGHPPPPRHGGPPPHRRRPPGY